MSGVLYYTDNGEKTPSNLVVTAQYLYPLTIGSTSYTSFDWTDSNIQKFEINQIKQGKDWRKGCLHSH